MNEEKVKIDLDIDIRNLSENIQTSITKIDALEKKFNELEQKGGKSTETLSNKVGEMGEGLEKLSRTGQTLTKALTLPILGFGAAAIKTSADFEMGMAEVAAISGASKYELEKLTETARELGSTTFKSSKEAAEAMKYFALAGFDANEIMSVVPTTIDLAVASGMDLGRAADIVSDNISALGLEVSEASDFIDKLAKTSSSSNTTIEMMGEAFKYVAPLSNTLGISVDELAASIGILGDNGIKGSMAGTVLRGALSRLVKPTKEMKKTMEKYGIELKKADDGSIEWVETIKGLKEKLGGLDKATQAQALSTLFGQEAMSGMAALINTSSDRWDELTEAIANSSGTTEEMAEIMGDTLQGSINGLKSAFEGVLEAVGNQLSPTFKEIVDDAKELFQGFLELDEGTQKIIITFAGAAAAVGPLMVLFGGVGKSVLGLTKVLGGLMSGFGLTVSASTLLIGGLIALGVAFGGALAYMGSSADMISYLQTKFGAFGTFISYLGEFIYGTFQLTFGNIMILVKILGKMLMALVSGDFKEVGAIWKDGWAEIENNTAKAVSNINMETARATETLRKMSNVELKDLENSYVSTMETLKTATADNLTETANTFATQFKEIDNKTIAALSGTSETMSILLEGIKEGMDLEDMTKKFEANLKSMSRAGELELDKLDDDFENFFNTIEINMKTGSTQIEAAGQKLFENFGMASKRGIDEASQAIAQDIKNMDQDTFNLLVGMGGTWGEAFGGIGDIASTSTEQISETVKNNFKSMEMSGGEVMEALKNDMNLYIANQELANVKLTESNQKMVQGVSDVYNTLSLTSSTNVKEMAGEIVSIIDNMAIGSIETMQGMGSTWAQIFKGVKEDGSMSSKEMKAQIISNIQGLQDEGIPIAQGLQTEFIGYLEGMRAQAEEKSGQTVQGVSASLAEMSSVIDFNVAPVPEKVAEQMSAASQKAGEGAQNIKNNINNGLSGTTEAAKANIDVSSVVLDDVNKAATNAQGAMQIKNNIINELQGLGLSADEALSILPTNVQNAINNGTLSATQAQQITNEIKAKLLAIAPESAVALSPLVSNVQNATNNAKNAGVNNISSMSSQVSNKTSVLSTMVSGNMNSVYNAISTNTAKSKTTATTNMQGLKTSVDKASKGAVDSANKNFKNLEAGTKTSFTATSKEVQKDAQQMSTALKKAFNDASKSGISSMNSLKSNVISSTNAMKNTAINNWNAIRREYGKTIKGRIEITKTTKEQKIVSTKKEKGLLKLNTFNIQEAESRLRAQAVETLSNMSSNAIMDIYKDKENTREKDNKEGKKTEKEAKTTNTYITNNYTSPKAMSILELKREARREARKELIYIR